MIPEVRTSFGARKKRSRCRRQAQQSRTTHKRTTSQRSLHTSLNIFPVHRIGPPEALVFNHAVLNSNSPTTTTARLEAGRERSGARDGSDPDRGARYSAYAAPLNLDVHPKMNFQLSSNRVASLADPAKSCTPQVPHTHSEGPRLIYLRLRGPLNTDPSVLCAGCPFIRGPSRTGG